ncbi:MAG: hypothetical protein ACON44_03875 [Candidatus Puniceispirillaceae bacterium]
MKQPVQNFADSHHWQTQSQRDLVVVVAMMSQPALRHRLASWPVSAVVLDVPVAAVAAAALAALAVVAELAPEVVPEVVSEVAPAELATV